jgi:hypothetical protein
MQTVNTFYKYRILIGIIVGTTSLFSGEVNSQSPTAEKKIIRILFVGNSYVYSNNLPEVLEVITNNSSDDSLYTEMVTIPGSTLQIQWELGEALQKIQTKNWDYVILQEHSTLGPRLINGQLRINDPANFYKYVRLFNEEITKDSSETLLLLTWARKSAPEHQPKINNAYLNIGNELDIKVIPVGAAWQEVLNNYNDIDLYWNDDSHPTYEGSYLSACVIYSSLFEKSPIGLIYNFEVNQVSEFGEIDEDSSKSIIEIDSDEAKILQSAAWEVHNKFIVSTEVVFPVPENTLHSNQVRIKDDDFVIEFIGDWEGQLVLFEYQTDLFLEFELAEDSLNLSCEIARNGSIHHTTLMVNNVQFKDEHLSFSVKREENCGIIKFDGKLIDDLLIGIAEYRSFESHKYYSGFWKLEKDSNR